MKTTPEEQEVEELKEDANPKQGDISEDQIKAQINTAIKDEKLRVKATQSMAQARKNLGLIALEDPTFKPTNTLEELIHTMRWNPEALFECTVYRLLEFESVLCAHVLWVKARENKWNCSKKMSERSLDRALMLAAKHCPGKTIREREAVAMDRFEELRTAENIQDIYNLYSEQCNGLADSFIQMDNCLKRVIDTRKTEMEKIGRGV